MSSSNAAAAPARQHTPMTRDEAERLSLPDLSLPLPRSWPADTVFPRFTSPRRVGRLSLPPAGGGAPVADGSELKPLRVPENWRGLDLNDWLPAGGGGADPQPWQRDIDDLLTWLRLARPSLSGRLVCCRGLVTRLVCTQLERQEDLCVSAVRVGGATLLCQFRGGESARLEAGRSRRDRIMAAWGGAFEAALIDASKGTYCEVVEAELKNLKLLYLGEVDCCDGRELVELKLTGQNGYWGKRLPRWWAQSFLLGVPCIVAGFRDGGGRLRDLQRFRVTQLPAMAREHVPPRDWSPSAGLDWAHKFLSHTASVCATAEEASAAFVFYWRPGMESVLVSRHSPASPFYFLPHWLLRDLSRTQSPAAPAPPPAVAAAAVAAGRKRKSESEAESDASKRRLLDSEPSQRVDMHVL